MRVAAVVERETQRVCGVCVRPTERENMSER